MYLWLSQSYQILICLYTSEFSGIVQLNFGYDYKDTSTHIYFSFISFAVFDCLFFCLMVFNATFNSISFIVAISFLGGGEPGENHRPVPSHPQTVSHNVVIEIRTHNIRGDRH